MHEPENSVSSLFNVQREKIIQPSTVGPKLNANVTEAVIELRNSNKKDVTMLDGLNKVMAETLNPKKESAVKLHPEVKYFVETYRDALADLSDEIAVSNQEVGKIDIDARTEHAVINQRFAQALYSAARTPRGSNERQNISIFYNTMRELSDTGLGSAALKELNNARAQASVMISLENAGYTVLVPDPDNFDEVRDMDVLAMADLIAISEEGNVTFIDVKGVFVPSGGRSSDHVGQQKKKIFENDIYAKERENATRQIMQKLSSDYSGVYNRAPERIELSVPTSLEHLSVVGDILNPNVGMDIVRSVR